VVLVVAEADTTPVPRVKAARRRAKIEILRLRNIPPGRASAPSWPIQPMAMHSSVFGIDEP
jgi:hypothetical protein